MFNVGRGGQRNSMVGIEVGADGIAIARAKRSTEGKPLLTHCHFIAQAVNDTAVSLKETIAAKGLSKEACNWVLTPENYTLLLVEAPNVPDEELREAMRWRVKELIPFSVEQCALDIFDLPADGARSKKMVYVVVSEKSTIEKTIEQCVDAKLRLKSIDICEMALRNLARVATDDPRGVGIIRLRQGKGNLALLKEGQLYLSRSFDIGYDAGLLDDLPEEALILELQRSLDYYERQMGQPAPANLFFCGENILPDKITQTMRNSLPGQVHCLTLTDMFEASEDYDEALMQLCLGAIGGALREGRR